MSAERRTPRRGAQQEATGQLRMRRAVVLSAPPAPAPATPGTDEPQRGSSGAAARTAPGGTAAPGLRNAGTHGAGEGPRPGRRPEGSERRRPAAGGSDTEGGTAEGAAPAGNTKPSQRPLLAAAAVAGAVLVALPLALSHNDKDNETDFEASGQKSPSPGTADPNFIIDVPTHPEPETSSRSLPSASSPAPSSPSASGIRVSPGKPYQGPGIRAPHPHVPSTPRSTPHAPQALAGGAPARPESHPVAGDAEPRAASPAPVRVALTTAGGGSAAPRTAAPRTAAAARAAAPSVPGPSATPSGPPRAVTVRSLSGQGTPAGQPATTPQGSPTAQTAPAARTTPASTGQTATAPASAGQTATAPASAGQTATAPASAGQTATAPAVGGLVVQATRVLEPGTSIVSDRAVLSMREDGNLVVTDENGTVRWSSHTEGRGYKTVFQADGHLVVYTRDDQTAWSSGTAGHDGAELVLQDDGDVVIQQDGTTLWVSGTAH
ncbi:hypothetical protein AB0F30_31095 [Streptomyces sp. NPDC029006]|uniref:hypothetical protein n=1 Tax=Streptomyces sp. NPDC029006 TaxID=3155467 RepID=UPI0033FB9DB7